MTTPDLRKYKELETKAGLYGPVTYGLLNFYSGYQQIPETDVDFFPLTAAQNLNGKNRLPFIIGVVPPSTLVSSKLLDRSATIATLGLEGVDVGQSSVVPGAPVEGDAGTTNKFQQNGSKAAKQAKQEQEKIDLTPLNYTGKGELFQSAQKQQIKLLQEAMERMASTPPLRMLVNPSKFGVKSEKLVADGSWARNSGTIIEHWGDQQDKISASGKIAGFYALSKIDANGPGLTRTARHYSESWANFQALYHIYRNNGAIFLQEPTIPSETMFNLPIVGSVYIYYDNTLYYGSFDTFSVTESDTTPFTVEYSFEFTVRAFFSLDFVDERLTYGAPGLFRSSLPIGG